MKFEFKLMVKDHITDSWSLCAKSVVKEEDFNNAQTTFKKYQSRGDFFDSLILINKLDDDGEFIECVQ